MTPVTTVAATAGCHGPPLVRIQNSHITAASVVCASSRPWTVSKLPPLRSNFVASPATIARTASAHERVLAGSSRRSPQHSVAPAQRGVRCDSSNAKPWTGDPDEQAAGERVIRLLAWAMENGVSVQGSPLSWSAPGDIKRGGAVVLQPVAAGQRLLVVPLRLAIIDDPDDPDAPTHGLADAPSAVRLAAKLLREVQLGPALQWADYLQVLPTLSVNVEVDNTSGILGVLHSQAAGFQAT